MALQRSEDLRQLINWACASGKALRKKDFAKLQFAGGIPKYEQDELIESLIEETAFMARLRAEGENGLSRQHSDRVIHDYSRYFEDTPTDPSPVDEDETDPRVLASAILDNPYKPSTFHGSGRSGAAMDRPVG
ncbi:hypothetical protein ACQP04_16995 [Pseudonocardia halophobica]|uniref:hypothetical protein n=1 Tax=Pseudonocardia halophobica TaxID=29401 RepID=UPI003D93B822